MASKALSELTAVTSVGDDDLIYVADTADGGTTFTGKKVTRANLFSGIATESYVGTQISNLIDGAPDALNTLNEIAAALGDDANVASSLTTLINANETHIDNNVSLLGVTKDDTDLGTFTGTTIADSQTVKAALQTLETTVEDISAVDTAVVDAGDNVNRLVASTSADTEPAGWHFLAVDTSDGSIKVIDKTFLEA